MSKEGIVINFSPTIKQDLMFDKFEDETTTEILFGGSMGAAKTYGICCLMIMKCLQYPSIRIAFARNQLTNLKGRSMDSFFEVCQDWGLKQGVDFNYNSIAGKVKFTNGSEVVLVELNYLPSDPKYTRLGGLLATFGVIDEIGEVDEQGYNIFKTRLGRWKNDDFGLKPALVMTCNPVKNWLYREFYKKHVDGTLEPHKVFIQALPTDNPYLPQSYLDNLMTLPLSERDRVLNGNWEYEGDPTSLMSYEEIANIWDNVKINEKDNKYITADIAFTSDKCVIMTWHGHVIIDILVNPQGNLEDVINEQAKKHNIPQYNIAYDSDGVGKFLTTRLRNAKAIVNNSAALDDENYKNLKTQLYYKLAEKVKDNSVKTSIEKYKEEMIEELQVVRYKPTNTVGKLEMVDKGDVKKILGRSPDFSDAMAFRMYFDYKKAPIRSFTIV